MIDNSFKFVHCEPLNNISKYGIIYWILYKIIYTGCSVNWTQHLGWDWISLYQWYYWFLVIIDLWHTVILWTSMWSLERSGDFCTEQVTFAYKLYIIQSSIAIGIGIIDRYCKIIKYLNTSPRSCLSLTVLQLFT